MNIQRKGNKCLAVLLLQVFFAAGAYCQTQEWTFTSWQMVGEASGGTDYSPGEYHKVYLHLTDSTYIWRFMDGSKMSRSEGTFVIKDRVYFLKNRAGVNYRAEIDSANNVTCVKLNGGSRMRFLGKVEQ